MGRGGGGERAVATSRGFEAYREGLYDGRLALVEEREPMAHPGGDQSLVGVPAKREPELLATRQTLEHGRERPSATQLHDVHHTRTLDAPPHPVQVDQVWVGPQAKLDLGRTHRHEKVLLIEPAAVHCLARDLQAPPPGAVYLPKVALALHLVELDLGLAEAPLEDDLRLCGILED